MLDQRQRAHEAAQMETAKAAYAMEAVEIARQRKAERDAEAKAKAEAEANNFK